MAELHRFLAALGLEQYARVLAENDVDLDVLPDLSDDNLRHLGFSLGGGGASCALWQRMLARRQARPMGRIGSRRRFLQRRSGASSWFSSATWRLVRAHRSV